MAWLQASEGGAEFIGSHGVVKKNEFVGIIADALYSIGYSKTGKHLEQESGISFNSPLVKLFKEQFLDGQWNESVATLYEIGSMDETTIKLASSVILECKFFELLAGEKFIEALDTLRNEILPLPVNDDKKARYLCYFIVSHPLKLRHGTFGQESMLICRQNILKALKMLLPPSVLFPENRLVHLVEQAMQIQIQKCLLHNSRIGEMSLLTDHNCGNNHIPDRTVQVLQEHKGEVWFLKFSHNGKNLASSCSDNLVIIWEVKVDGQVSLKHRLVGHEKPVTYISWSRDGNQLLTCGEEETVRRWDVASGECERVYKINGHGLVSCEWAADGKSIFSGVNDKRIIMWDLDGNEVESLPGLKTVAIADLCITSDGKQLITVCEENNIVLSGLTSNTKRNIMEQYPIVSCTLSQDNNSLLVSVVDKKLHLWNISGSIKKLATLEGHNRCRFVVRSCFGGVKEGFIASGSEDSKVCIWKKDVRRPIRRLAGHTGVVNCVSWNPADPHMLATGSDDRTIRIWGVTPRDMRKCADQFFQEASTSR